MRRIAMILGLTIGLTACGQSQPPTAQPPASLIFLTRDGCVNSTKMRANLDVALRTLQRPVDYEVIDQGTLPSTDVRAAYPTPTVLYENRDLFGLPEPKPPYPEPT